MTKKEAREQNLYYTGMSFNSWDREKREYYKNRVKEINNIDKKREELYEKYLKDLESLNNRHEENLETLKKIKAIRKDSK